jgi:hypothetical protein
MSEDIELEHSVEDHVRVAKFYEKQLEAVIGGTILRVNPIEMDGELGVELEVKGKNGKIYGILPMRDEEGNGLGAFEVIETERGREKDDN